MWRASEGGAKAALSAMGVHILDIFIYLFGSIDKVRTTSIRRSIPVAGDDVVSVDLMFANGAMGTLSSMLTTPRQWRIRFLALCNGLTCVTSTCSISATVPEA